MMVAVMQLKEMLVQKAVTVASEEVGECVPIRKEVRRMENLLPQRMSRWWPRNFHCLLIIILPGTTAPRSGCSSPASDGT